MTISSANTPTAGTAAARASHTDPQKTEGPWIVFGTTSRISATSARLHSGWDDLNLETVAGMSGYRDAGLDLRRRVRAVGQLRRRLVEQLGQDASIALIDAKIRRAQRSSPSL